MIWLKILISLAIIAFCMLLGYFFSGKYRSRKRFYEQFYAFNERYLNELCYERKPVSEFLKSYRYGGDFERTLKKCFEQRNYEVSYDYLDKAERKECYDYFSMVGKGDSYSQKSYFQEKKGNLEAKKADCQRQSKERSVLYLKLGLLFGLAIVILIV